jgi:AcrR family transcriptional regulator
MAGTAAARGRQVRGQLVRAAAELIPERGWTGVSTRMLAERAGVAPGLVHYHFASLQALLAEAALGVLRDVTGAVGPLLEQASTPEEAIDLLLASLSRYTGQDATSLLVTETYLAATRDEELRRAIGDVLAAFRQQLADWLEHHGVSTPRETAAVLAAAVDGVLLHRALSPDMTAETVAPVLRRIVSRAGSGARQENDDKDNGNNTKDGDRR